MAGLFDTIGSVAYRLRNFQEAHDAHRNAAQYDKRNAGHLVNLAACLIELGRVPEALSTLKAAREKLEPGTPPSVAVVLWGNVAEIEFRAGDWDAMRRAYDEAIRLLDPKIPITLLVMADMAATIGFMDDSVELLARAVAAQLEVDLGEQPPMEFLQSRRDSWSFAEDRPNLQLAFDRVLARGNEPVPVEHQVSTTIELTGRALEAFCDLIGSAQSGA